MIKIRYTNAVDIGGIAYSSGFTPELYLDVDVGRPEYVYTEEGNETVDGSFERDFARVEKRYTVETHVQEYMLDALMLIQLHDYIEVYLSNGATIVVDEFRVSTPDWSDLDSLAKVTITFIVFNESVSGGCADTTSDCDSVEVPTIAKLNFDYGNELTCCEYNTYVTCDGGEVVDLEATCDFLEEIGAPNIPYQIEFSYQSTAAFLDFQYSEDNVNWETVETIMGGSGQTIIETFTCESNIYVRARAWKHGCDGEFSTVVPVTLWTC